MSDKILKTLRYKAGYYVDTVEVDGSQYGSQNFIMKKAYNYDGVYIGDSVDAYRKARRFGIHSFEKRLPDDNNCSIGFSERDQKWYGWSHRAIYGFGIGSTVKKGDCAYTPVNKDDHLNEIVKFWDDKWHAKTWGEHGTHREKFVEYEEVPASNGVQALQPKPGSETFGEVQHGVHVKWIYNDQLPNEKLRGTEGGAFSPYPEFGNGEWTAETMEDAKQMACDFADGVS